MQDVPSSKPNPVKLTNFHIVISSMAAVAGVAIAGYQAFAPQPVAQAPVNVVVSVDQPSPGESVEKTDAKTVQGEMVMVDATMGGVTVNGAKVVTADVAADNGVIHVIDTVLIPK